MCLYSVYAISVLLRQYSTVVFHALLAVVVGAAKADFSVSRVRAFFFRQPEQWQWAS